MDWFGPPPLEIHGQNVRLTTPQAKHYVEWARLREESRQHLQPWEPTWPRDANSRADWRRRLKAWQRARRRHQAFSFLIYREVDGTLVGGASLTNIRYGPARSAKLGYWMGAKFQGQGYMSDAVRALCDWAISVLALRRIEAGIVPENARSERVLKRSGFKREGFARAYLQIAGRPRDHILYAYCAGDVEDA